MELQAKIDVVAHSGMELSLPEGTVIVLDKHWEEFAAFKKSADPENPGNAIFTLLPAVASWGRMVKATDSSPTGAFQLKVGDLIIYTNEWDEKKAAHWLPIIVATLNEKLIPHD